MAAAFSDRTIVAEGQTIDEFIRLRASRRGLDFRVGRARPSVGDVFLDRGGEEKGVLEDDGDLGAERFLRDLAQVATIQRDSASGGIVEAWHQAKEGAFARAGATDDPDDLAGRDREMQIRENGRPVGIAKADPFEGDRAGSVGQSDRVGGIAHIVRAIEHLEATLRPRGCSFHRPGRVSERLERLIKHEQISAEDEERAEGKRSLQDMEGADVVHRRRAHGHKGAECEGAGHVRERELKIRAQAAAGLVAELSHFPILATEGVDHADGAEALLRLREQRAIPLVDGERLAADAFRKIVDGGDDERDHAEGKKGELPIDREHDREGAEEGNERAEDVREALVEHRLDGLRIVGDAEAGIARATAIVILERKGLQVGVEIGAQFQERLQADLHEEKIAGHVREAPKELDHDQRETEK